MWMMLFMSKILELFEIFGVKFGLERKYWNSFYVIDITSQKSSLEMEMKLYPLLAISIIFFLMFSSSLYFQAIRNGRWFNSGQSTHSIINAPHSSAGLGSTARQARKLVCKHRFWYPVVPSELFTKRETHNRHRNSRKWKELVVG